MIGRRFADQDGKLYFFSKQFHEKGILTTIPQNLFLERHLYSEISKTGSKDVALERAYANVESRAEPIVEKIVTSVRDGRTPGLNREERDIWDLFFVNQWKRVPDFHGRFLRDDRFGERVARWLAAFEKKVRPLTPNEKRDFNVHDPGTLKRLKQNIKVDALFKTYSRETQVLLSAKGLAFAIARRPETGFVLGSFPIVKMTLPGRAHLSDPTVEVWFPIAHDVAVSPAPSLGEFVIELSDDRPVWSINSAIFQQSTVIAGRSRALIDRLARAFVPVNMGKEEQ